MEPFTVAGHDGVVRKMGMNTGGPVAVLHYECEDCGLVGIDVSEFARYPCDERGKKLDR